LLKRFSKPIKMFSRSFVLALLPLVAFAQYSIQQSGLPSLPYVRQNGNHFPVLADVDTIAPTVGPFSFTPTVLDYTKLGTNNRVQVTMQVWDNTGGSGVYFVAVAFTEPSGNNTYVTYCNIQGFPFFPPAINATWVCTVILPSYKLTGVPANGTWNLHNLTAVDYVGNDKLYSQGDVKQKGWLNTIQVILPAPLAVVDLSYPISQVDVKKADNPTQTVRVPFNCTTVAPLTNAFAVYCQVFFLCQNNVWALGQGTARVTNPSLFFGTMTITDWIYFTGQCNLQGILTQFNGPSGGVFDFLYGTADPATMARLFPASASALLASPLALLLSIAVTLFLTK